MATSSSITLDDLEHLEVDNHTPEQSHLSYPKPTAPPPPERQEPAEQPRRFLTDRLYIGNLHPSVDEYTLLRVFSKFGKVTKLDFLFHKAGPMKGKPRGYAFIEYSTDTDAQRALGMANDKLLRGRKITVTHAQQAPLDQYGNHAGPSGHRRGTFDASRPTAISLLKSGARPRQEP
ncbi:RNA-binding domain-containing protein [Coprinellus micaceus]|uniref:Probable RNA-binding protein 18 n=1 Tax=Coprinellus micaceus TaxID=71717 RepID=A0A4Y7STR7_COPMI|nr:RNA-binding domain-containing protein [Coprinellus micaceus]TEB25048.1 RNA-binding domain-containing protein [Coprinellus micaceus]